MNCNKCGAVIDEASKYCGKCGQLLAQNTTQGPAPLKKNVKLFLFVIVLGTLVVGIWRISFHTTTINRNESVSQEMERTREELKSQCAYFKNRNSIDIDYFNDKPSNTYLPCAQTLPGYSAAEKRLFQEIISQREAYCQQQQQTDLSCSNKTLRANNLSELINWYIEQAKRTPGALSRNGKVDAYALIDFLIQSGLTHEVADAIAQQGVFFHDHEGLNEIEAALSADYEVQRKKVLCDIGFGEGIFGKPYCAVTRFMRNL